LRSEQAERRSIVAKGFENGPGEQAEYLIRISRRTRLRQVDPPLEGEQEGGRDLSRDECGCQRSQEILRSTDTSIVSRVPCHSPSSSFRTVSRFCPGVDARNHLSFVVLYAAHMIQQTRTTDRHANE